jgi:hypothetical protein
VAKDRRGQIEQEAAELQSWLEDKPVIPRFAAPLDRELSAR